MEIMESNPGLRGAALCGSCVGTRWFCHLPLVVAGYTHVEFCPTVKFLCTRFGSLHQGVDIWLHTF
jgi:hypothetical protein